MVLIAAAVCTKNGKVILSRQFVEMTKARIEGLLAAFPKLMTAGKQHTYVETDSVRYVYQPMEKLYMLLITTKASNILEDLETLRIFSKVIPEYSHSLDEKEIGENAFSLIFAFDEIVALGYRESVNLAQIKTFVEMDSHEEKVYQAVRQTQEREARQKMREKAKELQRQRMEASKRGGPSLSGMGGRSGGFSADSFGSSGVSSSSGSSSANIGITSIDVDTKSKAAAKPTSRNALKLGGKSKDVDSFVDQLKSEGEKIANLAPAAPAGSSSAAASASAVAKAAISADIHKESVHLKIEDKLVVRLGRDGGVQQFENSGLLTLRIADEAYGRILLKLSPNYIQGLQLQTHPNVDKELFKSRTTIGLKNLGKPFPLNTDVGVLKWRFVSQDESAIPLTINCWPSDNGEGGCDVNIEYELEAQQLELQDVSFTIPLPMNVQPTVAEYDGTYNYNARKHVIQWLIPVIDSANKSGSMEFSCSASIPGDFFPLQVSFVSKTTYAGVVAQEVVQVESEAAVKYSSESILFVEKYEIV
ncbi:coatomer subunit delta isoform X2 [Drosophila biarmipes]|uniref:coatomer subunit delta isoform X2 n=1 Tax=Drosophila biarmipes TaxID=125945 RepID=UPI0007E80AEF|nr:coatomer subunit delta isoform X2 [Drosophila biarmipes]